MTARTSISNRIKDAFQPADRGLIGVVDEILMLCREYGLQMTWNADCCLISVIDTEEQVSIPLGKSVFRAILARLAAICTDSSGEMISPYGGEGTYLFDSEPSVIVRVQFSNTQEDQRLSLIPERIELADSNFVGVAARV